MEFLSEQYHEPIKNIVIFLAVFVFSSVVLFTLRRVVLGAFRRVADKTDMKFDDIILRSVKKPSFWWVLAISLYVALATSKFPESYTGYGLKAIYILIIFSATVALASFFTAIFQRYIEKSGAGVPATGLTRTLINAGVLTIGFLIILNGLGITITPLLTALGVGGLAVALALQDTLSNFFAGVLIVAEKPLKVGDFIRLDSGEEGYVEDIGWRSTRIKKIQNNMIIIPNSKLSQSVITNFNMPEKRLSLLIPVGVSYASDPDRVEEILMDVAKKAIGEVKGIVTDPLPLVRFSPGFGESSLDFTVICYISEFVDRYFVQSEIRKRIFKRFKEEGIEIPFPVRTVHLKQDS
ncbi:MAG: mechanosensitive ion channel [Deltaproteobacteria bacterium]|nr:mechanosensitive ion channel [Deltaproteobacteria bacterium]